MSEHEFESYLDLLTKLLQLDETQRDAIANELRDHLENRLEELSQQGVVRERAVLLALNEFGDANTLAHELIQSSRVSKRRPVMRRSWIVSAGAVAAAVALFLVPRFESAAPMPDRETAVSAVAPVGQLAEPPDEPAAFHEFALDRDLDLLEQSRPVVYHDRETHLLVAHRMRFSHEAPEITAQDGPLLPEGVNGHDLLPDPGPDSGPRPLYGVLSATIVTFDDVAYRVGVALFDEQGGLLGTAHTHVHVSRAWVGVTLTTWNTHLLDFGPNLAWDRVARFDLSISELPVLTPDEWAADEPSGAPGAAVVETALWTELFPADSGEMSDPVRQVIDDLAAVIAQREAQIAESLEIGRSSGKLQQEVEGLRAVRQQLENVWFARVFGC